MTVRGEVEVSRPVEDDIAASVLPQKLFSTKSTFAWFLGTPFTSYPHRLRSTQLYYQHQGSLHLLALSRSTVLCCSCRARWGSTNRGHLIAYKDGKVQKKLLHKFPPVMPISVNLQHQTWSGQEPAPEVAS